jgi:SAM-dependent methyltransferase
MFNKQNSSQKSKCPVCQATDMTQLLDFLQVPVHCNVLWPTQAEARKAPKGDIRLGFCGNCGHIANLLFNPQLMEYTQAYENSLHFSPRFQSYVESLAAGLIERYDLHDKEIIEIGCGQGDFIRLLCKLGQNRGVGFDPSYVPEPNQAQATEALTFIQDFYSPRYANYKADLICCRHVLEHIEHPTDFLLMVRQAIGDCPDTVLFFEVPNVLSTLRDLAIWDIIYEHCSYFSRNSLIHLFSKCGFKVNRFSEAFAGQFLSIEATSARPIGTGGGDDLKRMLPSVTTFAEKYQHKLQSWQDKLKRIEQAKQRAVIWGAGSKGVTFLNTFALEGQIELAVDINPRKQGMYIPGTGQQIVSPDFLRDYQPDVVIVMNPVYKEEIRQMIGELGFTAEILLAHSRT